MAVQSSFSFPTQTLFGMGVRKNLAENLKKLGVTNPLVVTDPGLLQSPAFTLLKEALSAFGSWHLFSDVHPNPVEKDVIDAAAKYQASGCDGVICFGGGSALDTGKAVRLLIKKPGFALKEFHYTQDWRDLAPCICIPTTAGTGSEVGRSSVIILESTRRKAVIFHPALLANLVLLDPEFTVALPPHLTAATGADALTHCIESFTSPVFHPLCDGIALEGIHLVIDALPRAYRNGGDIEARGKMLVAAAMGAVAFQKDLGAAHSMAHPLSNLFGMHHGLANALVLPSVMEFNAQRKQGIYQRVGIACGLDVVRSKPSEADAQTIAFIRKFLHELGLDRRLSEFGVKADSIKELASQAAQDSCHQTNPVPVSEDDFARLYRALI